MRAWISPESSLLNDAFPLPLDQPFSTLAAARAGVDRAQLTKLLREGRLRRVVHGVYAAAQAPDSVLFRAQALGAVLPEEAVITGRTAAWLHGIPVLERGSHLVAPPLHVSDIRDTRVRRIGVSGTRRRLTRGDVTRIHGIATTTALRTACDLGRLLWRYDALAALDGAVRIGVDWAALQYELGRFKGYRGVVQLRELAPLADPGAESPGESALRLRWLEAGLPPPRTQVPVRGPEWTAYRLDVGLEEIRYGAEYDGAEHHSSAEDVAHDLNRRRWITEVCGWTLEIFTKADVYSSTDDIILRLRSGAERARSSLSRWRP